jgi:hypothetical protein
MRKQAMEVEFVLSFNYLQELYYICMLVECPLVLSEGGMEVAIRCPRFLVAVVVELRIFE